MLLQFFGEFVLTHYYVGKICVTIDIEHEEFLILCEYVCHVDNKA